MTLSPAARLGLAATLLAALASSPARADAGLPVEAARPMPSGIHFFEDDFAGARAQALQANKPLFVDLWATWCHTCLSMKQYVFPDRSLRPVADAVVWVSLETETEKNRSTVDGFSIDGLPTFLLLDPRDGSELGRWLGALTAEQLRKFVQEGVVRLSRKPGPKTAALLEQEGDAARGQRDFKTASERYLASVSKSAPRDPLRSERAVLALTALSRLPDEASARTCVRLALEQEPAMPRSSVASDALVTARSCAERLPKGDAEATSFQHEAIRRLGKLVADPHTGLTADDRSDARANLIELLDEAGRHAEAVVVAQARAADLEAAAAREGQPAAQAAFDAHRVDTYVYLGRLADAEALLSGREKQLPKDYNPPARLARVLLEERRPAEAERAIVRALSLMPMGPRRLSVLALKERILAAQNKPTAEAIEAQLAVLRSLPKTPERERQVQELERRLRSPAPHASR